MAFVTRNEKIDCVCFEGRDNAGKVVSNISNSNERFDVPKSEAIMKRKNKYFNKENVMSFIKGGAVGFFVANSWFDMSVPIGPMLITASFSAAAVAMNYNQTAKDFKEGFQKGTIVGTPVWILATNAAPGFVSLSLITIGTIWGICKAIKEKKNRKN